MCQGMPPRSMTRLRRGLLLGVLGLLILACDPLGLSSATDKASEQFFNRLLSAFYSDRGQQQIVLLLLDDAFLLRHDLHWPLPYQEQAKVLARLLHYRPQAVFVDLLYSHDHSRANETPQVLANVFARYAQQDIPVLLASTGQTLPQTNQADTLSELAKVTKPAIIQWDDQGDRYPLTVTGSDGQPLPTPAQALYQEYCQRQTCELREMAADAPPIAVQWGLHTASQQPLLSNSQHCQLRSSALAETFQMVLTALFWRFSTPATLPCPYTLTLNAAELETTLPEERALLRSVLQGRLVLVGADITGAADRIHSPVHGQIPAVYQHAMALDNLITLQADYYRDPPSLGDTSLDVISIVGLVFAAAILAIVLVREQGWFTRLYLRTVLAILLLAAMAVCYLLSLTPLNVVGLGLLSLTLFRNHLEARAETRDHIRQGEQS